MLEFIEVKESVKLNHLTFENMLLYIYKSLFKKWKLGEAGEGERKNGIAILLLLYCPTVEIPEAAF